MDTRVGEEKIEHQGIPPTGVHAEVASIGVGRAVEEEVGDCFVCCPAVRIGRGLQADLNEPIRSQGSFGDDSRNEADTRTQTAQVPETGNWVRPEEAE